MMCLKLRDIQFKTFVYEKKNFKESLLIGPNKLENQIIEDINNFLLSNKRYFAKYDRIVLYYDNGQKNIKQILDTVMKTNFDKFDSRKILPKDYKLFQVADLLCTLELIKNKIETKNLSKSEKLIFHNKKEFKKDFINKLWKKIYTNNG